MKDSVILANLKEVLAIELSCLQRLLGSIDNNYIEVVKAIYSSRGKLVIVGMGKSGYIAKKIVATMVSVGTKASFLHPSEACHGDLGILTSQDLVMLISNSGETEEVLNLLPFLKCLKIPLIAVSARKNSSLVRNCHHFLWLPVEKEACSMDLVPTSSTLLSLALGDALAIVLMKMKNFHKKEFAQFHPAGSLGKRLSLNVADLMLQGSKMPVVTSKQKFEEVVCSISQGMINATAVVGDHMELLGLITSYNLRSIFAEQRKDIYSVTAKEMMNNKPVTFRIDAKAYDALSFMKSSEQILNVLPIVDACKLVGILSLQSLIKAGL